MPLYCNRHFRATKPNIDKRWAVTGDLCAPRGHFEAKHAIRQGLACNKKFFDAIAVQFNPRADLIASYR